MAGDKIISSSLWHKLISEDNLYSAWLKVAGNMGAGGIDRVSIEDFQLNLHENLEIIKTLLEKQGYNFLPLIRFEIDKPSGGKRPLGIPAVRDRIVEQALLMVLQPVFDKDFLNCSYAYRPGKSPHKALNRVEQYLKNGNHWMVDADIDSFFETIDHNLLIKFIEQKISDFRIIELIKRLLTKTGEIEDKGISQGAVISPLLANIYLHQFDLKITGYGYRLVRYADDFLILCKSKNEAEEAFNLAARTLEELHLRINEAKTKIHNLEDGFIFLGYQFSPKGKSPSPKAVERLKNKIKTEANQLNPSKERLRSIICGWRGYFKLDPERDTDLIKALEEILNTEPQSIPAHLALAACAIEAGDIKKAYEIASNRTKLPASDAPETHYQWGVVYDELDKPEEAAEEFFNTLKLNPQHKDAFYSLGLLYLNQKKVDKSIRYFQKAIQIDPEFALSYYGLGSALEQWGLRGASAKAFKKAFELNPELKESRCIKEVEKGKEKLPYNGLDFSLFLNLFMGREGVYAKQWVDSGGKTGYLPVRSPLGEKEIKAHLSGEQTIGMYLIRADNTVKVMVIDIDVNKKMILKYSLDEEMMKTFDKKTQEDANKISSFCNELGINAYIEDSGYKGRHCWFFFKQPLRASEVRELGMIIMKKVGEPAEGIHRELFPIQNMVSSDGLGCLIKLPLGKHRVTQKRALFVDYKGIPYSDQAEFIKGIKLITNEDIKQAIERLHLEVQQKEEILKEEPQDESIQKVIQGCNVLRFLVNKAKETKDLNHYERLVLLYSLGHLGDEGKRYIHYVMSHCLNYSFHITQRWCNRLQYSPISCPKIRDWLSNITPAIGCYCEFKLPEGGYPSPVLYANPNATKQMGMKKDAIVSQHQPVYIKEEKPTALAEGESIDEIVKRYIELKKHKRTIELDLQKQEHRLNSLFDTKKTDSILTEFGVLNRINQEDKTIWMIEI
ncbi:MAG: CRISPR-associated primase-polymerase type A1 [bacterium]